MSKITRMWLVPRTTPDADSREVKTPPTDCGDGRWETMVAATAHLVPPDEFPVKFHVEKG